MSGRLHIVCLDAPSPPDYGGAIDMYYKLQSLAETGKKIVLHYFNYRPTRNTAGLEPFCQEIHGYDRKSFLQTLTSGCPYIVASRINKTLIERLQADDAPVLLEGLHCAGIIPFLTHRRRVVLRMHNEEAAYYRFLANAEKNLFKRIYFRRESRLLHRFQQQLQKDITLACLAETDIETMRSNYRFHQTAFIPCFIPWQTVGGREGKGEYCLYHGNLSVSENEEAAIWLIENVFRELRVPLWIAGKGISHRLVKKAKQNPRVKLIQQPSIREIDELIANAQINVLPSVNRTGVKLKLLNALFNGRFCITNRQGVEGSRITQGVMVSEHPAEWKEQIRVCFDKEFTKADLQEREPLASLYNNHQNAKQLNALW